jgi:hypothetical protein
VRQALTSALPPGRKRPDGRPAPVHGARRELIGVWLIADRDAPHKEHHTAMRIWPAASM